VAYRLAALLPDGVSVAARLNKRLAIPATK